MSSTNIPHLVNQLTQSFAATQAMINKLDLNLVVYADPEWRVRDVTWHLAVWDRQSAKSIQAFVDGSDYAIPNFEEHKFNTSAQLEGRSLTPEQLRRQCQQAREEFKNAVAQVPAGKENTEFMYPWGDESGDVAQLVSYMVEHDEEHRQEINSITNP
ncbi:MAG: maleylpyruvate isomerase N-terminal domain-containing protein [Anaerolineales bacterium]|nr:maleylpyruvate isomerase N-terminal domain-containing protein [Anaerolineales bacterium]